MSLAASSSDAAPVSFGYPLPQPYPQQDVRYLEGQAVDYATMCESLKLGREQQRAADLLWQRLPCSNMNGVSECWLREVEEKLVDRVFHALDVDRDGWLNAEEFKTFAVFLGYEEGEIAWQTVFQQMCDEHLEGRPTVSRDDFRRLVRDESKHGCFCTPAEMLVFLLGEPSVAADEVVNPANHITSLASLPSSEVVTVAEKWLRDNDIATLRGFRWIPCLCLRFTHDSVKPQFKSNWPVIRTVEELSRMGPWYQHEGMGMETLDIVPLNGKLYSLSNRRLFAFKMAQAVWHETYYLPCNVLDPGGRVATDRMEVSMTTKNDGAGAVYRYPDNGAGGRNQDRRR